MQRMPNLEELSLTGLLDEVTISTDRWGVAHIRASSARDVFMAQGFVAARDRMFQLDWWRRRYLGLVSAVLGPRYVERDRAARLFLYRGSIREEWLEYPQESIEAVKAFVSGINSWVSLTRANPNLLGPEFEALEYEPAYWVPHDLMRVRSHSLYANVEKELARALTVRDFGHEADGIRRPLDPPIQTVVPEGLDLSVLHHWVLDTYRLAVGPVAAFPAPMMMAEGSNNWVLSGDRTSTGRPILASDPHRATTGPSLRYLVHLTCPEFDVIGASEPFLPGVTMGHNGHVAFGLTIWPSDQEDLYVYELHPEDSLFYKYGESWERFTVVEEDVPTVDGTPAPVTMLFTRHGPVIRHDPSTGSAFAVRAAWLEPGMAPYLASLQYLRAKNATDFEAALDRWGCPSANHGFADADGNIGLAPRALIPIRRNWDGLMPVPGDGRYEWDGFRRTAELPVKVNPPIGFVASANEMNLTEFPDWEPVPVGYEWSPPYRMQRLTEVLENTERASLGSMADLQNDYLNIPARRLCAMLTEFGGEDHEAIAMLNAWDKRMTADSAPALLFDQWARVELRRTLFEDALAKYLSESDTLAALRWIIFDQTLVEDLSPDLRLIEVMAAADRMKLDRLLRDTLTATMQRLLDEFGPVNTWSWGDLHRSELVHPVYGFVTETAPWMTIGPSPKSGSAETVGFAAFDPISGTQTAGASFRMVVDVGDWDKTVAINTPGQVGDPRSNHYRDLYDLWLVDGYFPLSYTEGAVREVTETVTQLAPPNV